MNPRATYYAEAWGCRYRPSGDATRGPETVDYVLKSASDLEKIGPLDGTQGPFAEQLRALSLIADGLGGEAPFIQTVFSPLAVIGRLANGDLAAVRSYMESAPQALHAALRAVTETLARYSAACLEAGASGFFFATQMANTDILTAAEHEQFGVHYDLKVLEFLAGKSQVTMLHVCKENLLFDQVADYPVDVINWADRTSGTTLAEARRMTRTTIAGGLSLERLSNGTEEEEVAEARDAIAQAGRRGFILAPACVVRGPSPDANLAAARRAVGETTLS